MLSASPSRWKITAIAGCTLAAATFVAATTIGSVFARSAPDIALRWSPNNAEARGYRALKLFREQPTNPDWASIARSARASLARSPSNVPATTMLAAYADAASRQALADRLFTQSDRLSRREPIAQTYLIERAVARGDIETALKHYDAALSTSRTSANALMPVLVAASADPAIARPLAQLLVRRPVWREEFARQVVQTRQDPGASFPILLSALRLDPANTGEAAMLSAAMSRLLDEGHGDIAYAVYRRAKLGAPARPVPVRDGGFEGDDRLPPFDWEIHDGDGVSGSVQPLGDGRALFVAADGGSDQKVAWQRLLLAPGRYVLAAKLGSEGGEGGETAVSIACDAGGAPLATLRARATAALRVPFVVPVGCRGQRLGVLVTSAEEPGHQSWVDDVAIVPAPR